MIDINTPDTGNCFYAGVCTQTVDSGGQLQIRNQITHIFEAAIGAYDYSNNCIIIPTYDESIIRYKMWDSAHSEWDNPILIDVPFRYAALHATNDINVGNRYSNIKLTDKLTSLEVVKGSYEGNGMTTRTIELGFTPSAVLVMRNDGVTKDDTAIVGGLAVTGSPVVSSADLYAVSIVENGFMVARNAGVNTNMSVTTYNYVAFK